MSSSSITQYLIIDVELNIRCVMFLLFFIKKIKYFLTLVFVSTLDVFNLHIILELEHK